MIDFFVLCILVDSLDISFGKCHFICICEWGFTMFCSVFHVQNVIFICVSLMSFVIFLFSLPLYVKVAHFVSWGCESVFPYSVFMWVMVFHDVVYIMGGRIC
jgi:hypothetical protein